MNRAAKLNELVRESNAALAEAKKYDSPAHKAATKALSTVGRMKRTIARKATFGLSTPEKRQLSTIIAQLRRHDPSLSSKLQSYVNSAEADLKRYSDEVETAAAATKAELDSEAAKAKDQSKADITKEITDKIRTLSQETTDTIKKSREDTYADILGELRGISLGGYDLDSDKLDRIDKQIAQKEQNLARLQRQLSNQKDAVSVFDKNPTEKTTKPAAYADAKNKVKSTQKDITAVQGQISNLKLEKTKIANDASNIVQAAKKLLKSVDKSRDLGKGGLIKLGPIETMKVKYQGKNAELARLQAVLKILRAYGNTEPYRKISNKVNSREVAITRYERQVADQLTDLKNSLNKRIEAAAADIDSKYAQKYDDQGGKEKRELPKLIANRRQELFDAIITELERIKKEAERIQEWAA